MSPDRHPPVVIDRARPDELCPAFRLIFRHAPPEGMESRIATGLEMIRRRELDPAGVLVARAEEGLVGAMVCHFTPGASGLLWPPQATMADAEAIEDLLVTHTIARLRGQGAKLGQALLVPDDAPLAAPLLRHGFRHITNLWYMRHKLGRLPRERPRAACLAFEAYRECDPLAFRETLWRTCEGTLDCPEVNGVRTIEEIVVGHQAQGTFDPDRWWLVREYASPVGVVLLTDVPAGHGWDVAYLGVVPEARRRGIGRDMTVRALREAAKAKQTQLTLAVDARNQPAWKLYRGLGFEPYDQRQVYLAVWGSS
jgi:ribosomal protein S18 acetylase RimI-like enzyme